MKSENSNEFLGILMLDTSFPRIHGDAGNPASYPFPTKILVVSGAESLQIVKNGKPDQVIVENFQKAAIELEAAGAKAIVSTCGFLVTIQHVIASSVGIPVIVSSLSLYQHIRTNLGFNKIGILTASRTELGEQALESASINPDDVHITGFEDCEAFTSVILQPKDKQSGLFDQESIQNAAIDKAKAMVESHPEIGAFILECGNLPPYSDAITKATNKPVFSILDAAEMMMNSEILKL